MTSLEDLEAEVLEINKLVVASSSRTIYLSHIVRFVLWLLENKPTLISDELLPELQASTDKRKLLKDFIGNAPRLPGPIKFPEVQARDFCLWLASLEKSDGKKPGKSLYSSARSSFFHLFVIYKQTVN